MEEYCNKAKEVAGGPASLAKKLGGLTSQAVGQWRLVPPARVIEVEQVTGLSRHLLRPDVFGPLPANSQLERSLSG